jgi:biopolymer transport protein ExbB
MNFHQILQDLFIGLGVDWVLWVLVALSVYSVALIVERWIFYFRRRVNGDEVVGLTQGTERNARGVIADSMECRVLKAADALVEQEISREDAEAGLEIALRKERQRYERGLTYLATLGNNAPFVGLLGTVIGIMAAFFQLANIVEAAKRNEHLMNSISEALVATAMGILVAIPAVAFYNIFRKRVSASLEQAREIGAQRLLHAFEGRGKDKTKGSVTDTSLGQRSRGEAS